MGKKKDVIIIIPGTKALVAWSRPVQFISKFLAKIFRLNLVSKDHPRYLHGKFNSKKHKIVWLRWSRGITGFSRWFGKKRLKKLLRKNRKRNVKIIGISMAGDLILEVFRENIYENVKKIILIGAVNTTKVIDFKHPLIINIYSKKDKFSRFATRLISPINGGKILKGKNIKNIQIPSFTHEDFCYDCSVKEGKYNGKKISDIVRKFLGE